MKLMYISDWTAFDNLYLTASGVFKLWEDNIVL